VRRYIRDLIGEVRAGAAAREAVDGRVVAVEDVHEGLRVLQ